MENHAIKAMIAAEESHPWYRARLTFVNQVLKNFNPQTTTILDFGCGSGAALQVCKDQGFSKILGLDTSDICVESTRSRNISVEKISSDRPILRKNYNLILCLDVLEHLERDVEYLKLFGDHLAEGGKILITVPAHQFLWSKHDELNHHFRRYSKRSLLEVISAAGLQVNSIRYWNSILFPAFILERFLGRFIKNEARNEFVIPPKLVRLPLFTLLKLEAQHRLFGKLVGLSIVLILSLPQN